MGKVEKLGSVTVQGLNWDDFLSLIRDHLQTPIPWSDAGLIVPNSLGSFIQIPRAHSLKVWALN